MKKHSAIKLPSLIHGIGVSCLIASTFSLLQAQEEQSAVDPFGDGAASERQTLFQASPDEIELDESLASTEISVLLECFELDHETANKLIREYTTNPAAKKTLRAMITEQSPAAAKLVETIWLRGEMGKVLATQSILEKIYPTEYEPPELPNVVGSVSTPQLKEGNSGDVQQQTQSIRSKMSIDGLPIHITSATPSAFDTRNVGDSLEIRVIPARSDGSLMEAKVALEMLRFHGRDYYTREGYESSARGIEHISMPIFYSMSSLVSLKLEPGIETLVGIYKNHTDSDKRIMAIIRIDLIETK